MRFGIKSLATRLGLMFALGSAVLFAAMGQYVYSALQREIADQDQDHLNGMVELVIHTLDQLPSLDVLVREPALVSHLLIGHGDLKLWVYDDRGRALFSSSDPEVPRSVLADLAPPYRHPSVARWWHAEKASHRVVVAGYHGDGSPPQRATIVLALDVSHEAVVLRSFRASVFGSIAGASLIAAALGFLIARQGLRPILRMADAASRITVHQLDERLDPARAPQELATLVTAFNTMLARLQDSFSRLSEFSADLAHELRTPLTNLFGRIQVVLSHKRSEREYREALEASVEDVQQLSALVTDMLFLAQADNAQTAMERQTVDLRAEADNLVEYFGTAAEERGISIVVEGYGEVQGDRQKLRRALANLLSNAIRHSPDVEPIAVTITSDAGGSVTVAVTDRGQGIPAEHQVRIFDRFYRADASRARHSGGTGLGLAIARSIAQLHGGQISVRSVPGSTTFELTLPSSHAATVATKSA